ncbi:MAG: hypothetical protein WBC97_00450 [Gemmatimonadales bacterium]
MRLRFLAGLLLLFPVTLTAQASAYVPLDDPRLPILEHLITRGDVADPSPMIRPFRRADAERVLAAADTAGAESREIIGELRTAWAEDTTEAWWRAEGHVGAEAYTSARRDALQPSGPNGVMPYVSLGLTAKFGNIIAVSRPTADPRLPNDPDWPGRHDLIFSGRMTEAYLSGQWKWARLYYGQMDQNWGPQGVYGIPLSSWGYPRPEIGLELGTDKIKLTAQAADLLDERDSTGTPVHRYWFAHRLSVRPSLRLSVALWETYILGGPDQSFAGRVRNPLSLLILSDQYGLSANGNLMVGSDVSWRAGHRVTLQGQLAIDDISYQSIPGGHVPNRYAFTVAAFGPLGRTLSWRALYTQASTLAFHTISPWENFADAGVGLGREFPDNEQLSAFVTIPVGARWLLTPEVTYLRQGAARITDSWPSDSVLATLPQVLSGTVARTLRAAVQVSGASGPVQLSADLGFNHVTDADNVAGRSHTRFEGRFLFTLGLSRGGSIQ